MEIEVRKLILTKGKTAIIDAEDFNRLDKWKWSYKNNGYAVRRQHLGMKEGKQIAKMVMLHREIINVPNGMVIDHINGNGLDNRKVNLRICTHQQNAQNSKKRKGKRSKYKGVSWFGRKGKWFSRIKVNGKQVCLGYYYDEMGAGCAYDAAAKKYFGQFAKLNKAA